MITIPKPLRVVYISSYPPRKCGIATYTKDLANGINSLNPECFAEIIAMDDSISESLEYPWEVSKRIRQNVWEDYEAVLDYINDSVIDVVCLQHEYGIYGDNSGMKVVEFVQKLKKPLVVTFHSVLEAPNSEHKSILKAIAKRAERVVVMLESTRDVLVDVYGIDRSKVEAIHHGAPDFAFEPSEAAKKTLKLTGRTVMSSINLLGRGRGIEYAIEALPAVVKKHPDFLYLVIGQTHPSVLKHEGEVYRRFLEKRVRDLGLQKHVRFINRYVSLDDLIMYVRASDFYVTPYENMETASSGSLAYAIAAGKLCIATPFKYAVEMFAGGRGMIVPPKDPKAIGRAIIASLAQPATADRMRMRCYQIGRKMTWNRVGFCYFELFHAVATGPGKIVVPPLSLRYIQHLTHKVGLVEHTSGDVKNHHEGYAVDDNARALLVAVGAGKYGLASRYLHFLEAATRGDAMVCDRNLDGSWHGKPGYGDWYGRAIWALSYTVVHAKRSGLRQRASRLLTDLLPGALHVKYPRAAAYVILGLGLLQESNWSDSQDQRDHALVHCQAVLLAALKANRRAGWRWIDKKITYDNPRIAQALIVLGRVFGQPAMVQLGCDVLEFLLDATYDDRLNHFRFVGNKGWYSRGGPKSVFDEQPIEAGATVLACVEAYHATGRVFYKEMAMRALAWFYGENTARRWLYRPTRGAVYDGITPDGLNLNQGAESTLEYVLAVSWCATLEKYDRTHTTSRQRTTAKTASR